MNETTLRAAVAQMRKWQKEYFRTRNPQALNEARRLEKKVDRMLEELDNPGLFVQ